MMELIVCAIVSSSFLLAVGGQDIAAVFVANIGWALFVLYLFNGPYDRFRY